MFNITENRLLMDGRAWYKDEFDNTVFVRKETDKVIMRLRFKNKQVVAGPITLKYPPEDNMDGIYLHVERSYKEEDEEDVKSGINGFTKLVQHWVDLMHTLRVLDADSGGLAEANNMTVSEVEQIKKDNLDEFDELKGYLNDIYQY